MRARSGVERCAGSAYPSACRETKTVSQGVYEVGPEGKGSERAGPHVRPSVRAASAPRRRPGCRGKKTGRWDERGGQDVQEPRPVKTVSQPRLVRLAFPDKQTLRHSQRPTLQTGQVNAPLVTQLVRADAVVRCQRSWNTRDIRYSCAGKLIAFGLAYLRVPLVKHPKTGKPVLWVHGRPNMPACPACSWR